MYWRLSIGSKLEIVLSVTGILISLLLSIYFHCFAQERRKVEVVVKSYD